jgi:hypothetical protein
MFSKVCHNACITKTKSTIKKVATKGLKKDFKMYLSKIFIEAKILCYKQKCY